MAHAGKIMITLIVPLLLLTLFQTSAAQELSKEKIDDNYVIKHNLEFGRTDALGGGSYLKMDLEAGTSFMVIWGDRKGAAPITILSKGLEIIGRDMDPEGYERNIQTDTLLFYRLEGIKEFQDTNGNGIHDLQTSREQNAVSEPVLKGCSLSGAWTLNKERPVATWNSINWRFSLSASNISYRYNEKEQTNELNSTRPTRDKFLDRISFTFDISISANEKVVRVKKLDPVISSAEALDEKDRAKYIDSSIKIGTSISGWDFERDNPTPAMGVIFSLRFMRTFDPLEITRDATASIRDSSIINYRLSKKEDGNTSTIWNEDDPLPKENIGPFLRKDGGLLLENDGGEKLRFLWKGTAFDDVKQSRIGVNIQFLKIGLIGPRDTLWENPLLKGRTGIGIFLQGAFIYKGSGSITHDPEIGNSGMVLLKGSNGDDDVVDDDSSSESNADALDGWEVVSVATVFIVVLILISVAIMISLTRRKYDPDEEDLLREEEEDIFIVRTRKKDWDRLRPK